MGEVTATFCSICSEHCSALVTVEDNKIVKWDQDKESGLHYLPCAMWKGRHGNPEIAASPERLKYPLKRVGARGEGKWQRISWDEAFDTITEKFTELKKKYGPQALAAGVGEPRGFEVPWFQRFCTAFGTPNVYTPFHLCGAPGMAAGSCTFGSGHAVSPGEEIAEADLPKLLIMTGGSVDKRGTHRERVRNLVNRGTKLVVIDPRQSVICKWADLWIRDFRPGSDPALVFGMLKVIIEEELYDKDFVEKWTIGFDELKKEIKKFTLDDVEDTTWIPKEQIQQLARWYGTIKPAQYGGGHSFGQSAQGFQRSRLVNILEAIVDPRNIPGWGLRRTIAARVPGGKLYLLDKFPRSVEGNVGKQYKYMLRAAVVPSQAITAGMVEDKLKMGIFVQCNPLITWPNARRVYDAFMKLDFLVVADVFMIPTAAIADIVLPAATVNECDVLYCNTGGTATPRAFPKILDPPGEAMSDVMIINNLAKRLGLAEHFFDNDIDTINYVLGPTGFTWEDFKQKRVLQTKLEKVTEEGDFFTTPSGKAEIYSNRAVELYGCKPIPTWEDITPFFHSSAKYPMFLTSYMDEQYHLSKWKSLKAFRQRKPFATVHLHPDVAQNIGAQDGDWVWIETDLGRTMQKLVVEPEMSPRVVLTSFGWWYPEAGDNTACGWDKSNINILIPDEPCETASGSTETRGYPCRVYKAAPEEVGDLEERFKQWMTQAELVNV